MLRELEEGLYSENVRSIVIDYRRTHIINENLLRESDKLLLMCDRSSRVYPLCWALSSCWTKEICPFKFINVSFLFTQSSKAYVGRKRERKKLSAMEHTLKDYIWEDWTRVFFFPVLNILEKWKSRIFMITHDQKEHWHEQRRGEKTKNKWHSSLIK